MGYRVAVVGATGAVGREMLKTLAERNFPVSEVAAVASGRSAGAEVSFGEKPRSRCRTSTHSISPAGTSACSAPAPRSPQCMRPAPPPPAAS